MATDQEVVRSGLSRRGAELRAALDAVDEAKGRLREVVRLAPGVGITEVEVARLAGISRPTVRDWLGKA